MKDFVKAILAIILGLCTILSPIIWGITYIHMVFVLGFGNIPTWSNVVGIMAVLTMISTGSSTIRAIDRAVENHKALKKN